MHSRPNYNTIQKDKLKIATINIPDIFLQGIEDLVNCGVYPSRSEACREAVKRFLKKQSQNTTKFQDFKLHLQNKLHRTGFQ